MDMSSSSYGYKARLVAAFATIALGCLLGPGFSDGRFGEIHSFRSFLYALKPVPSVPVETETEYWITRADYDYICQTQPKGFQNPITVPSGISVRYSQTEFPSPNGGPSSYEMRPLKKLRVIYSYGDVFHMMTDKKPPA